MLAEVHCIYAELGLLERLGALAGPREERNFRSMPPQNVAFEEEEDMFASGNKRNPWVPAGKAKRWG